jgi:hypothetical protein
MLNNLSDTEQEEAELRYLFGEAMSEYLQGYAYEQGPPAFDTLETASLNLGDDIPRQRFDNGGTVGDPAYSGGLPGLSDTNMSDITGTNDDIGIGVMGAGDTAAISIALGSSPISAALGLTAGVISQAVTGKSPVNNALSASGLPSTESVASSVFGNLGITSDENTSYPQGIEEESENTAAQAATTAAASTAVDSDPASDAAATAGTESVANAAADLGIDMGSSTGSDSAGSSGESSADDGNESSGGEYSGGAKEGGQIKGYREGDLVETDQADTQLDGLGLGPLGIINDPDGTTGIADDLDMDLPVGSFVLNKEAVKLAGVVSINKMIKEAIDLAIEDGVDLPAEIKTAEKIPIKISKGEGAIPATIVGYIGEKKLENLNNRGLKVMKQKESEEAPVEMAAAPSPQEDLLAQIQSVA